MPTGAVQPVEVTDMVTDLRGLAGRFDADAIDLGDVRGVLGDLGTAKRLIEGMVVLMARRLTDLPRPTTRGPGGTVAHELARATGTTTGQAKRQLGTSTRLAGQDRVADRVRAGQLSCDQAEAVSDAVAADPDAEATLLDAADTQSVEDLRKSCRDTKTAADPNPDATRLRHHVRRSFRSWHASDGEWQGFVRGPADVGARIEAALRGEHDRIFRAAHAAGRRETAAAYRFDALLALLERGAGTARARRDPAPSTAATAGGDAHGEPAASQSADTATSGGDGHAADTAAAPADRAPCHRTPSSPGPAPPRRTGRQTKVIVVVDGAALKRGRLVPGDTCEIAGVGRVSLSAVKALIPDAHIAYVIRDAVDTSVTHLGRQATAHQRTALEARGYECEVPGCRAAHLLEIDHVRDWAFSRTTRLQDLAWLCPCHHDLKSRRGHRLTGPPGQRCWTTADGRVLARDPDPAGDQPEPAADPPADADPLRRSARPPIDRHPAPPTGGPQPTGASEPAVRDLLSAVPRGPQRGIDLRTDRHAVTLDGTAGPMTRRDILHRRRTLGIHGWRGCPSPT